MGKLKALPNRLWFRVCIYLLVGWAATWILRDPGESWPSQMRDDIVPWLTIAVAGELAAWWERNRRAHSGPAHGSGGR